MEGLKNIEF